METSDLLFVPDTTFGAEGSVVWVVIVGGWATLLFAFALFRYWAFRKRCMHAAAVEAAPLAVREGHVVLGGEVETEDGGPAIRFVIEQHGTEVQNKNQWSHTWKETTRQVQVRPFHLRLADETRVLVVPDEKVKVVDDLVTEAFKSPKRRRVAELSSGERVWVRGVLRREGRAGSAASAYRGGEAPLVLRRSPLEPLDIASGSLTVKFARWRRFYRVTAIVFGILFGITHLGFFGSYYVQCAFGEAEPAAVTGTRTYVTKSKSTTTRHYVIEAKLDDGIEVSDEVAKPLYEFACDGKIKEVPFRVVPMATWIHSIGTEPVASIGGTFFCLLLVLATSIGFFFVRRSSAPWYEQRRVVERRSGRLFEHAWDKQVPSHPDLHVPGARKKRKQ